MRADRWLLPGPGWEAAPVTLAALHLNPTTTTQIHLAHGTYLLQVKENQPELRAHVKAWARRQEPLGAVVTKDRAHGRSELRRGTLVSLEGMPVDRRWRASALRTLFVLERETEQLSSGKFTTETSYSVTNRPVPNDTPPAPQPL